MVRNLHTGHTSPQYHVVFDDRYGSVFNLDAYEVKFDAMCNKLFENSHNWYAEEEHDDNDNLIYKSPPLGEVWLSEPERQDRCASLEEQCHRQETREGQLASDVSKNTRSLPENFTPGLIVSDD